MDIGVARDILVILFTISSTLAIVLNMRRIDRLEAKVKDLASSPDRRPRE
jgi:hypothetical protein